MEEMFFMYSVYPPIKKELTICDHTGARSESSDEDWEKRAPAFKEWGK